MGQGVGRRGRGGEGEKDKKNDQSLETAQSESQGRTHFVALFCNFHGFPLVRPAEDCASSRGPEVDGSEVVVVVVDMVGVFREASRDEARCV